MSLLVCVSDPNCATVQAVIVSSQSRTLDINIIWLCYVYPSCSEFILDLTFKFDELNAINCVRWPEGQNTSVSKAKPYLSICTNIKSFSCAWNMKGRCFQTRLKGSSVHSGLKSIQTETHILHPRAGTLLAKNTSRTSLLIQTMISTPTFKTGG